MPPFRPNQAPQLFEKLAVLGVNAMRLQFNWEAFEPEVGVYDETYLDYYAGVVERAAAQNVLVLVDVHQDAFSRNTMERTFNAFMAPGNPARERYLAMLGRLAHRFAKAPNVIGYDLLNEPNVLPKCLAQRPLSTDDHRDAIVTQLPMDRQLAVGSVFIQSSWHGVGHRAVTRGV